MILLIVLSFVSLFNGCSLKDIKPYEDRLAEKKCQEILSAIDNKDADSLKALFSKQSLADATDLDQGVEYILALFLENYSLSKLTIFIPAMYLAVNILKCLMPISLLLQAITTIGCIFLIGMKIASILT